MQFGRNVLYTDVKEITRENIADILRLVIPLHEQNAVKMTSLLEYEAGNQQKLRIKKFRPVIYFCLSKYFYTIIPYSHSNCNKFH